MKDAIFESGFWDWDVALRKLADLAIECVLVLESSSYFGSWQKFMAMWQLTPVDQGGILEEQKSAILAEDRFERSMRFIVGAGRQQYWISSERVVELEYGRGEEHLDSLGLDQRG